MMSFASLLWSVRGSDGNLRPARKSPHTRRTFLPRLEALEDRTVPSTLTVLNSFDKGALALCAMRSSTPMTVM
jgi:hypothetical protein